MSRAERRIDAAALERLGFAKDLIEEATRREDRGILAFEPPPDLVQRTIDRCAHLFPQGQKEPMEDAWKPFAEALGLGALAQEVVFRQCADLVSELSSQYMRSLGYAFSHRDRPLLMLENHNLIQLSWWERDPLFRCMRTATGTVNRTVRQYGVDASALVVVLRPKLTDYSAEDLETIGTLVQEGSSDIYWMRFDAAERYAEQDVVVVGEESLLKIEVKTDSPLKAFGAMKTTEDRMLVRQVRSEVLACIKRATPIKVGGKLYGEFAGTDVSAARVRSALGVVISGATTRR